jgi:cytochrome P450
MPGYPSLSASFAARRAAVQSLPNVDGQTHTRLRRALIAQFTVKRVKELQPFIQQTVDHVIDEMLAGPNPTDFVEAFAVPVPLSIICELLGVPYADREFFRVQTVVMSSGDSDPDDSVAAVRTLSGYLAELIDARDANPENDVLSMLATEQVRSGAITREEATSLAMTLLVGGHETTAGMLALSTLVLLTHREQLAELRQSDDPKLIDNAVEELLRYVSVAQSGRRRVATQDINVGGQLIREGEGVIVANNITNRDPDVFPDPDELDLHRQARHHMAFGYGVHQCLGQMLVRAELRAVFSTLYRRVPTLAVAVPLDQLAFNHDGLAYGVKKMPVTW